MLSSSLLCGLWLLLCAVYSVNGGRVNCRVNRKTQLKWLSEVDASAAVLDSIGFSESAKAVRQFASNTGDDMEIDSAYLQSFDAFNEVVNDNVERIINQVVIPRGRRLAEGRIRELDQKVINTVGYGAGVNTKKAINVLYYSILQYITVYYSILCVSCAGDYNSDLFVLTGNQFGVSTRGTACINRVSGQTFFTLQLTHAFMDQFDFESADDYYSILFESAGATAIDSASTAATAAVCLVKKRKASSFLMHSGFSQEVNGYIDYFTDIGNYYQVSLTAASQVACNAPWLFVVDDTGMLVVFLLFLVYIYIYI